MNQTPKFIESIRYDNGQFHLLVLHQERVNRTFTAFFPGQKPLELAKVLPNFNKPGKHKFRLEYDPTSFQITHSLYEPKVIKSVRLVNADHLDYSFKYQERTALNELLKISGSDEIIMVKDGLITDASYANIACFDGDKWWTPEIPLLAGIKRQNMLEIGIIKSAAISPDQLSSFRKICLINAMMRLNELEFAPSVISG